MKVIYVFLFIFSSTAFADSIRFNVGGGEPDLDLNFVLPEEFSDGSGHTYTVTASVGYLFSSNIFSDLEIEHSSNNLSFGGDDNISFNRVGTYLGYHFQKNKFYLDPKVGFAYWELRLKEGRFLNSGPEAKLNFYGSSFQSGLTAGYQANDLLGVGLSYRYIDFDQGHSHSYMVEFNFNF